MERPDPAVEHFEALKAAATHRLREAQAALGTPEADDIVFDASLMTARMLGYVEGLAIDRPAQARELVLQTTSVIEAISRLSNQAQRALADLRPK